MLSVADVMAMPEKGIVELLNKETYRSYIIYTDNIFNFIIRTIKQLKDGTHKNKDLVKDRDKLIIALLNPSDGHCTTKLAWLLFAEEYRNSTKDLYNKIKKINPKLVYIPVEEEYEKLYVDAYLVTKRKKYFIKRYNNMILAKKELDGKTLLELANCVQDDL